MMELKYVEAFKMEAFGDGAPFGLKILISTDHEISDDEKTAFYRAKDLIEAAVLERAIRLDPEESKRAARQKAELLSLFPRPIFVEEIPNGYCDRWCCKHLPWFVVTTEKGRITVGWRKRVINISWDPCVSPHAESVFPLEDVTKFERTIHAWGVDKAREYIGKLLA